MTTAISASPRLFSPEAASRQFRHTFGNNAAGIENVRHEDHFAGISGAGGGLQELHSPRRSADGEIAIAATTYRATFSHSLSFLSSKNGNEQIAVHDDAAGSQFTLTHEQRRPPYGAPQMR